MTKFHWLVALSIAAVGCGEVNKETPGPNSCKVACTTDADCTNGQTCGELGLCANPGDMCSCNANEFISCNGETKISCNAAGSGISMETCGTGGCNETEKRCNGCVASTDSCSTDGTKLEHCGPDGVLASTDTCGAGCITGTSSAACGHIKPEWLPGVCTTPAMVASVTVTSLDTNQDAQCTGGAFALNGTQFCAIRAGTINIGDLKVTGARAVAFVADDALNVTGVLDVSADGTTSGPGGGATGFGGNTTNSGIQGAGGGGFAQTGGNGGAGDTGSPAGSPGGAITPRETSMRFMGGSVGGNSTCGTSLSCIGGADFASGGAGGGALLIACRGKVTVSATGVVDAGGGGGAAGGDHFTAANSVSQGGAAGGGSGGYVVFQGVTVELLGKFFANGGGGGSGCGGDNCRGFPGADGPRGTGGAAGGFANGNTCNGGAGGSVTTNPAPGQNTFSSASAGAGGGGGSMGRFEVFTPAGHTPAISTLTASPTPVQSTATLTIE